MKFRCCHVVSGDFVQAVVTSFYEPLDPNDAGVKGNLTGLFLERNQKIVVMRPAPEVNCVVIVGDMVRIDTPPGTDPLPELPEVKVVNELREASAKLQEDHPEYADYMNDFVNLTSIEEGRSRRKLEHHNSLTSIEEARPRRFLELLNSEDEEQEEKMEDEWQDPALDEPIFRYDSEEKEDILELPNGFPSDSATVRTPSGGPLGILSCVDPLQFELFAGPVGGFTELQTITFPPNLYHNDLLRKQSWSTISIKLAFTRDDGGPTVISKQQVTTKIASVEFIESSHLLPSRVPFSNGYTSPDIDENGAWVVTLGEIIKTTWVSTSVLDRPIFLLNPMEKNIADKFADALQLGTTLDFLEAQTLEMRESVCN
jgi:hypothetical protein